MLVLSLLWLAQVAIEITGGTGCPEPAAVSRSLTSLLPAASIGSASAAGGQPGAPSPSPPNVRLSGTATGELEILLVGPDGRRLDERRLRAASACDDLAAAAAVVIATWVSEPALPLPERVDLPRPPAASAIPEEPASVGSASTADGSSLAVVAAPWRPSSSTSTVRFGAVASSTAGQWAAGLRAGGGVILWGNRWGLGAAAAATMPRSESVGSVPGAARWTRGYLGVGPEVTLLAAPVTLTAHLHGLVALLHVTGNGLDSATSDTSLRFGSNAGLWSAWHGQRGIWPWIGADLLFWPGRERLRVDGLTTEGTVPGLEAQVAAGLGIDLFR